MQMTHKAATAMGVLQNMSVQTIHNSWKENQMPLATGVQILTCIGRLDMLAHGFEFGGVGGAVGGLCCVIQHHLLLTCPEGLTTFYTDCIIWDACPASCSMLREC